MQRFEESELILNADQRLYHIQLKNEDIADQVILVGDPGRVSFITKHFSSIEYKSAHREFIAHTGYFNGTRLTVLSTGIGTDNIDIVMNELDAAVNIDPTTRQVNATHRSLNIFRLGTSGALQADMGVNEIVCSSHGLGLDGLLNFYADWEKVNEKEISEAFREHCLWPKNFPYPYCVSANDRLLENFKQGCHVGITATAPGFYGPQGRELRLKTSMPTLNNLLATFNKNTLRITNFEMETSAMYGLGKLLGHSCLTLCVIIANRVRKEFSTNYNESVEKLIEHSLHKISLIHDQRRINSSDQT